MRDLAAALILAPILLAQGRRVRRTTPKLAEPAGPRSGVAGSGPALRLLILGDSSGAGVGAADQRDALSGQVVSGLSLHFCVSWTLVARTGATTASTLAGLDKIPQRAYDAVILCLGVNDVTGGRRLGLWLVDQGRLFDRLAGGFGAKHLLVCGLPPMGRFPALPQPLRWYLGRRAVAFDTALETLCAQRAECVYVKSLQSLDTNLMASDGFHPGPEVYRLWGAYLAARIAALISASC